MTNEKMVCFLYRTKTISPAEEAEMGRQREACLRFAEQRGWVPIREFWAEEGADKSVDSDDPLLELRAGAEKGAFQVLLVSEFDRIGRLPLECGLAAGFFEQCGVEVWTVRDGHIGKGL